MIYDEYDIKIREESGAMAHLFTVYINDKLLCSDVPFDKAELYIKGYICLGLRDKNEPNGFKLSDYVKRHYTWFDSDGNLCKEV